jgi:uncharacterized protein (AIM24 family)
MADFARMPHPLPPQAAEQRPGGLACRVAGDRSPHLAVALGAGQRVLIDPQALLWKEPALLLVMVNGLLAMQGPGHFGVARGEGGAVFPIPLLDGEIVQVRHGRFLVSSGASRTQDMVQGLGDRLSGASGLMLDRFTAGSDGAVLWVQAEGDMFERELIDGEVLDLSHAAFLCKDAAVAIESVAATHDAAARVELPCLRLTGPGRVAFQTAFRHAVPAAAPAAAELRKPQHGLRGVAGSLLGRGQG